jgi:5-methylcytosine-specific restriction endonuclease McrA
MNTVFVLDTNKKPLNPVHPGRVRTLLSMGKAAVFRRFPFTIILKYAVDTMPSPFELKIDPGSKTTGIVLVEENSNRVVFAAELQHHGQAIHKALNARRAIRRGRRNRKTRYRQPRFDNRTRPPGWLPPSLQSRVDNVRTWATRLSKLASISSIAVETVCFDMQLMENSQISGVEYQQGTLAGYELREYLLEKWSRKCAYCGASDIPLQVEHIMPKAKGGSNRPSNLTLACEACNIKKGTQTAAEFGHPEIQARAKTPLRNAAAVNATRYAVGNTLKTVGLPVSFWSGGRTKMNRIFKEYPKAHWIDAACVGETGTNVLLDPDMRPLLIKSTGHGTCQMCGTDKYGFPIRHRSARRKHFGFETGDMVRAVVLTGKKQGIWVGRVLCRATGSFDISTVKRRISGIHARYCASLYRKDGYAYT